MAKKLTTAAPTTVQGTNGKTVDTKKLVTAFLNLRDARQKLAREFEKADAALKAKQELIEAHLLKFLNEHKMDSAKAGAATFYRQEEIKPAASDWETVWRFAKKHDAMEIFEKRLRKTFVQEYMEAHDGAVPPGVSVHREYVVRVRRGN